MAAGEAMAAFPTAASIGAGMGAGASMIPMGVTGSAMAGGGLGGMMAAHPGWTGALKGAGAFGATNAASSMMQPQMPPPPKEFATDPQFTPAPAPGGDLAAEQLKRLRAYFMVMPPQGGYGQGGMQ